MINIQLGIIINNYKFIEEIKNSNFGSKYVVQYIVYDRYTGEPIIKEYYIDTLDLIKLKETGIDFNVIQQEINVLKKLSQLPSTEKYISCYHDDFIYNNMAFIVSDKIEGKTLDIIIQEQMNKEESFTISYVIQTMYEISLAVDYLHSNNIAHQNIKPENIIYDSKHNKYRLIDFIFSCSENLNSLCKGKLGTIYYMPPELLNMNFFPSKQDFSFRKSHDIWSMGVVFYQIANLGQNYINFKSNDTEIISKDIQLLPVNNSNNNYTPINSIIKVMLNKNYLERPTSGQVVILIKLARPLCVVNNKNYDRQEAIALVMSLGIKINDNIEDHELCSLLTDYLNKCQINNNEYDKQQLLNLAKFLNINITDDISNLTLCNNIQKELNNNKLELSIYITNELLRAIEYMTWINIRSKNDTDLNNKKELNNIFNKLVKKYNDIYNESLKLQLINTNILKNRKDEMDLKSNIYWQNASPIYSEIYNEISNNINKVISSL